MRGLSQWPLALLALAESAFTTPTYTPFRPPSYPLAVRSPYVSAWIPGSSVDDLPARSPQFWFGNELGWAIIGRVNGVAYNLFGLNNATTSATVESGHFSATHSIFTLTAGEAQFTLDFFSPVSFTDYTRASFPFSYLTVSATPLDGASPSVQVYSDIDASWTGQDDSTEFTVSTADNLTIYQLEPTNPQVYSQSADEQALWGQSILASSASGSSLTARAGPHATVRNLFRDNGVLSGSASDWASGDVAALAHDLGNITAQTNVTYTVGHVREEAINYLGDAQTHYYRAKYPTTAGAVAAFLDDYDAAFAEAASLESEIQTKGTAAGGQNYTDVLSLSMTQTMGGIEFTIPASNLSTDTVYAFIKEISSDGNINTIDIIVELIPFFKIFNIDYLQNLLDPIMAYLGTGRWPQAYMIHDLGTNYPNATGHDDGTAETMPVEESGNLMYMAAAIEKFSGSTTWTNKYSDLLTSYADYLIANGEYPDTQLSTTDGLGEFTNMTSLAVKAAIGLAAYGNMTDNSTYTDSATQFTQTISTVGLGIQQDNTTNAPYFTLEYGDTVWYMLFNVYPDKLLGLGLLNQTLYDGQSALMTEQRGAYGVPIEGNVDWGKTDWQMWTAAVSTEAARTEMIDDLYAYASNGENTAPFADRYWATGSTAGAAAANFRARPVTGAHFAVWALLVD